MWQINETFDDYMNPRGKSSIYLNADQDINPYHIIYPITWKGYISGKTVLIIQQAQSAISKDDFEFKEFPLEHSSAKGDIINAIHNYLRKMN